MPRPANKVRTRAARTENIRAAIACEVESRAWGRRRSVFGAARRNRLGRDVDGKSRGGATRSRRPHARGPALQKPSGGSGLVRRRSEAERGQARQADRGERLDAGEPVVVAGPAAAG